MPVTPLEIEIAPDCKTIIIHFNADPTPELDTITLKNEITTTSLLAEDDGTISVANKTWTVTSTEFEENFNGVFTVNSDDTNYKYYVGRCELDCCIASLVQSAIDCHCECDKCDEDLRRAEKVHLLANSALYSAINDNVTDAINKYNKAKAFCVETCACGC
jgi:hypothetical protein